MLPNFLPKLVTRTHLRVVDSTLEFGAQAFNARHHKLKATSCNQLDPKRKTNLAHNECKRSWKETGPFETRVVFWLDEESAEGHRRTQRGYLPTLDPNPRSHGQLASFLSPSLGFPQAFECSLNPPLPLTGFALCSCQPLSCYERDGRRHLRVAIV